MQVHDPLIVLVLGLTPALIDLDISMQTSSRLYNCLRCHAQVIICHRCDRGNRYCLNGCSKLARRASLNRASKKYQQSSAGRANNTARQKRFREQYKQIVTHHSSQTISLSVVLKKQPTIPKSAPEPLKHTAIVHCHACKAVCNPFLRHDFLRGKIYKGYFRL